MQPLQRSYAITEERIESMLINGNLNTLYDEAKVREFENQGVAISDADKKKLNKFIESKPLFDMIIETLRANISDKVYLSPQPFIEHLKSILSIEKKWIEKIADGLSVMDKSAEIHKDKKGSLLFVLKHGVEISNYKLNLMYTKPATTFNKELIANYEKNIFSVMEEVWASDKERIDLVIFLNGLAIMSFELKCNMAGQSYEDAIYQYRTERNPKTRLFLFKAGCLVNFAMDLNEVYMTTKLEGKSTFFLPFNMGNGEGIEAGKGNPSYEDKYSVYYMWEDILRKLSITAIQYLRNFARALKIGIALKRLMILIIRFLKVINLFSTTAESKM